MKGIIIFSLLFGLTISQSLRDFRSSRHGGITRVSDLREFFRNPSPVRPLNPQGRFVDSTFRNPYVGTIHSAKIRDINTYLQSLRRKWANFRSNEDIPSVYVTRNNKRTYIPAIKRPTYAPSLKEVVPQIKPSLHPTVRDVDFEAVQSQSIDPFVSVPLEPLSGHSSKQYEHKIGSQKNVNSPDIFTLPGHHDKAVKTTPHHPAIQSGSIQDPSYVPDSSVIKVNDPNHPKISSQQSSTAINLQVVKAKDPLVMPVKDKNYVSGPKLIPVNKPAYVSDTLGAKVQDSDYIPLNPLVTPFEGPLVTTFKEPNHVPDSSSDTIMLQFKDPNYKPGDLVTPVKNVKDPNYVLEPLSAPLSDPSVPPLKDQHYVSDIHANPVEVTQVEDPNYIHNLPKDPINVKDPLIPTIVDPVVDPNYIPGVIVTEGKDPNYVPDTPVIQVTVPNYVQDPLVTPILDPRIVKDQVVTQIKNSNYVPDSPITPVEDPNYVADSIVTDKNSKIVQNPLDPNFAEDPIFTKIQKSNFVPDPPVSYIKDPNYVQDPLISEIKNPNYVQDPLIVQANDMPVTSVKVPKFVAGGLVSQINDQSFVPDSLASSVTDPLVNQFKDPNYVPDISVTPVQDPNYVEGPIATAVKDSNHVLDTLNIPVNDPLLPAFQDTEYVPDPILAQVNNPSIPPFQVTSVNDPNYVPGAHIQDPTSITFSSVAKDKNLPVHSNLNKNPNYVLDPILTQPKDPNYVDSPLTSPIKDANYVDGQLSDSLLTIPDTLDATFVPSNRHMVVNLDSGSHDGQAFRVATPNQVHADMVPPDMANHGDTRSINAAMGIQSATSSGFFLDSPIDSIDSGSSISQVGPALETGGRTIPDLPIPDTAAVPNRDIASLFNEMAANLNKLNQFDKPIHPITSSSNNDGSHLVQDSAIVLDHAGKMTSNKHTTIKAPVPQSNPSAKQLLNGKLDKPLGGSLPRDFIPVQEPINRVDPTGLTVETFRTRLGSGTDRQPIRRLSTTGAFDSRWDNPLVPSNRTGTYVDPKPLPPFDPSIATPSTVQRLVEEGGDVQRLVEQAVGQVSSKTLEIARNIHERRQQQQQGGYPSKYAALRAFEG